MVRDDVCDRVGLAASRHADERLVLFAVFQSARKLLDRLGLVTGRLEF